MTLYDFLLLPDAEKATLLYKKGTYHGKRRLGSGTVLLYQLEGFYAEVYYREYRRIIECIRPFDGTERLDPYLEEIDVEHLV